MKKLLIILLMLGFVFTTNSAEPVKKQNLAVETSKLLSDIQKASLAYYKNFEFWPINIEELKNSGYLNISFKEKSPTGGKWIFKIKGKDLSISTTIPDKEKLADLNSASEVLDVASRSIKNIKAEKKRFAEGDRVAAQTAATQKESGSQAFNRSNLERRSVVKSLIVTDDEDYLKSSIANKPLERDPFNYIKISATLKGGAQITTDKDAIDFNSKINFERGVSASSFVDSDNPDFLLNPEQTSKLNDLSVSRIIDTDDDDFFIDPNLNSNINELNVTDASIDNLIVEKINNQTPVVLEELEKLAVTKLTEGKNIKITADKNGSKASTGVGITYLHIIDNPEFTTVKASADIDVGGNLTVGGTTENIINSNFSLGGDDAYIAGDIGISGNIYTNNSLILDNSSGNRLSLNGDYIESNGVLALKANADSVNYINLSSNGSDLTLATSGSNTLNIKAESNILFQTENNATDAFSFKNSTGSQVFTIDTLNNRVSINADESESTATLHVKGSLHTSKTMLIEATGSDIPLSISKTSNGQWLSFNDGTDAFGIYNTTSSPEGNLTANIGSMALDTSDGDLYVKRSDGVNTDWKIIPNAGTVFIQGGNNFGTATAVIGSNDANSVIIKTNNIAAITIDASQTTTVSGNLDINNNNITNAKNISVDNIKSNNGSFTFTLGENNTDALIIKNSTNDYLKFDTTNNQIVVGVTTTFGSNLMVADNVDIGGGTIDGVSLGSNTALISIGVGSLTLSGNSIISSNGEVDFGANTLTINNTLTASAINLTNGNIQNANNIALTSISPASSTITINLDPNQSQALSIKEGVNSYITLNTTGSGTITIDKDLVITKTLSHGDVALTGGTIDNVIIGGSTPTIATFTTLTATTLSGNLNTNNKELSNLNVVSGSLDNITIGANTSAISIKVGNLTLSNSTITTTSTGGISFGSNDLKTTGTLTTANIVFNDGLSGTGDIVNAGDIKLNSLTNNTSTLLVNISPSSTSAFKLTDNTNDYIVIDSNAKLVKLTTTTFTGDTTIANAFINGGEINGVSIGSTTAATIVKVGSLTLSGSTITSTTSDIGFDNKNLSNIGTITTSNLVVSDASIDNIKIDTLEAKGNTITFNIKDGFADALKIEDSNGNTYFDIDTSADLINQATTTFTGETTINNANITSGNITASKITATSFISVGNLKITSDGSLSTITTTSTGGISFGGNDLKTTGTLTTANIVFNDGLSGTGDIVNAGDIKLNSLTNNTSTLLVNISPSSTSAFKLTDNTNDYIIIDSNAKLVKLTTTTFTGDTTIANALINGGEINGVSIGSTTAATIVKVGNLTLSGSTITSTTSDIGFDNKNLSNIGTITTSNLVVSDASIDNIKIDTLEAKGNTITFNIKDGFADALKIEDESNTTYFTINTGSKTITQSTTTFTGKTTLGSVEISSGNILVGDMVANNSTIIGSLTISGNATLSTITTTSTGGISFGSNDLKTTGTLTVGTLDLSASDLSNLDSVTLNSISNNSSTLAVNISSTDN
jgi:hypothetical protein